MRNKIIGYVSAEDPFRDKKAWSGTKYKIREALQNAGYEVVWISCKPSKICFIFPLTVEIFQHIIDITNKNQGL